MMTLKKSNKSASAQLHKSIEELKAKVKDKKDLYDDREAWTHHQELQSACKKLIIDDVDYAIEKKVEVDLWNHCFKNYISHLQAITKDRSVANKKRAQGAQVTLAWFLDTASGFYFLLLQDIRVRFDLDIPFLRTGEYAFVGRI